jgi:phosphopantetheinyl transferase (holo-ACP synthase)
MIGNDVVDLKQAAKDSNWNRPRFFDKVFTKKEQSIIFSSENRHQMVWLLWSMKEAAYKAHLRETNHPFFNPKRIQCQPGIKNEGVVHIDDSIYYLKSKITTEYIYSLASNSKVKFIETDVFKLLSRNQSEAVRSILINQMSNTLDSDSSSLRIEKTVVGVPNVFLNGQQLLKAISITHHGQYGAYAIC